MAGFGGENRTPGGAGRRVTGLRVVAAAGAVLGAWVAADSFLANVARSEASGGWEFFLFWGVPFAAAAAFLGWVAVRGHRPAARNAARSGCLMALVTGGLAFSILFLSPVLLHWDSLRGAVAAFLYAPLAATIGLVVGLTSQRLRRKSGGESAAADYIARNQGANRSSAEPR